MKHDEQAKNEFQLLDELFTTIQSCRIQMPEYNRNPYMKIDHELYQSQVLLNQLKSLLIQKSRKNERDIDIDDGCYSGGAIPWVSKLAARSPERQEGNNNSRVMRAKEEEE
jgi:hypothetical protein